jgi:microcystin-dependent protein
MNLISPRGLIVKWSGTIASIPTGYLLCDGTNNTPDMRSRFSRGVNTNATDPGTTGGEDNHVLITAELPTHSHGITETSHQHTVAAFALNSNHGTDTAIIGTGGGAESSSSLSGVSVGNTGGGLGHENRPTYYECLYIMKSVDY